MRTLSDTRPPAYLAIAMPRVAACRASRVQRSAAGGNTLRGLVPVLGMPLMPLDVHGARPRAKRPTLDHRRVRYRPVRPLSGAAPRDFRLSGYAVESPSAARPD